ncbi:hypothetical protein NG799_03155 [Laspinema sp. D1]|uniref:Uncharacterized protein n=1 Tax=Laspinema palackyanum D2a TaxID=2953684 RepID=A0ABT2MKQ8_9CYAN|nr:hypothetical protein [Laspinema sp. D2a]
MLFSLVLARSQGDRVTPSNFYAFRPISTSISRCYKFTWAVITSIYRHKLQPSCPSNPRDGDKD